MREMQLLTLLIVLLAVPFLVEAMRAGLGRALAAMAVMGTWLGVTLAGIRKSTDPFGAGEAVRDYLIVMTIVLFLYFGGRGWIAKRSRPDPSDGSAEDPQPSQSTA